MRRVPLVAALLLMLGGLWYTGLLGFGGGEPPAEPEPVPPPPPPRVVSICAVGDVMLDRNVGRHIQMNGAASIVEKVAEKLHAADLTFANLECPLSSVGPHSPVKDLIFRARPETVEVLQLAGTDIVSLANNHTLNAGREGIVQTLEHLDRAGIRYCGAALDRDGTRPAYMRVGDTRLAFIAFTDLSFGHGSHSKVDPDRANIVSSVETARNQADLVIVSLHWGEEYRKRPTERQKSLARALIDAGADLVLGHHPHVLEGIEVYRGRPVLYSMGNFVFDQYDVDGRMESAIFTLTWHERDGWAIEITPVWIDRRRMGPVFPDQTRRDRILQRMVELSAELGTQVAVEDGRGYVSIPVWREPAPAVVTDGHAG